MAKSNHFNGVISTDEGNVQVINGTVDIDGETFHVSDDGQLVVDKNGSIVAVIINGKAEQVTPEIVEQLKAAGLAQ